MTFFDAFRLFVWLVVTVGAGVAVPVGVIEWADSQQFYGMPESLAALAALIVGECLVIVVSIMMWTHGWPQ